MHSYDFAIKVYDLTYGQRVLIESVRFSVRTVGWVPVFAECGSSEADGGRTEGLEIGVTETTIIRLCGLIVQVVAVGVRHLLWTTSVVTRLIRRPQQL